MGKIEIKPTALEGVLLIGGHKFEDHRGYFIEIFNRDALLQFGIDFSVVQVNYSFSRNSGTIRGLHYQLEPFAQAKIVRCNRGAIFDVAVDLRSNSPTFGKYISFWLRGYNLTPSEVASFSTIKADYLPEPGTNVLIPKGFAHGFLTLTDNTEVIYFLNQSFVEELDRSIRWNDPQIAIEWPLFGKTPILSNKDEYAQFLENAEINF